MNPEQVKKKLIDVIRKIQVAGGYEDGAAVGEDTVPLEGLEGFDSKLAPIATRRLARELEIEIPKHENIFREGGSSKGRKLSIAEIAALVTKKASVTAAEEAP